MFHITSMQMDQIPKYIPHPKMERVTPKNFLAVRPLISAFSSLIMLICLTVSKYSNEMLRILIACEDQLLIVDPPCIFDASIQ